MNINNEFASADLTAGQLNAIVKKLGGHEKALAFLRGEITVAEPVRKWREQDGIIYFSVTSNGKTGQDWLDYFTANKIKVSDWARELLLSNDFEKTITNKVATEIAVLNGMLWNDNDRTIKNIRAEAKQKGWLAPNAEVACLIRAMFTDQELKDMGFWWIITMHEPIKDSDGDRHLLHANRYDGACLGAGYGEPGDRFNRDGGFAFAVLQVPLEN